MDLDKEIFFSEDIYKGISEETSVRPEVVKKALTFFLSFVKTEIIEGDGLIYGLPYLGYLMINLTEANREKERFNKKMVREKDPEKKEYYRVITRNYRTRIRKLKVEILKGHIRRKRLVFYNDWARRGYFNKQIPLNTPYNLKKKALLMGESFEKVVEKQNKYSHKYNKL